MLMNNLAIAGLAGPRQAPAPLRSLAGLHSGFLMAMAATFEQTETATAEAGNGRAVDGEPAQDRQVGVCDASGDCAEGGEDLLPSDTRTASAYHGGQVVIPPVVAISLAQVSARREGQFDNEGEGQEASPADHRPANAPTPHVSLLGDHGEGLQADVPGFGIVSRQSVLAGPEQTSAPALIKSPSVQGASERRDHISTTVASEVPRSNDVSSNGADIFGARTGHRTAGKFGAGSVKATSLTGHEDESPSNTAGSSPGTSSAAGIGATILPEPLGRLIQAVEVGLVGLDVPPDSAPEEPWPFGIPAGRSTAAKADEVASNGRGIQLSLSGGADIVRTDAAAKSYGSPSAAPACDALVHPEPAMIQTVTTMAAEQWGGPATESAKLANLSSALIPASPQHAQGWQRASNVMGHLGVDADRDPRPSDETVSFSDAEQIAELARPVPSVAAAARAEVPIPATTAPLPFSAPSGATAIIRQVADVVVAQRDGKVEIILNPEELGRMIVTMSGDTADLRVTMSIDRPETRDLISRHADLLMRDLRDSGVSNARLAFHSSAEGGASSGGASSGGASSGGASSDGGHQRHDGQQGGSRPFEQNSESPTATRAATAERTIARGAKLDIRI